MVGKNIARRLAERVLKLLIKGASQEIKEQGHVASGTGLKSLEPKVIITPSGNIIGQVLVEKYMLDLDSKQAPKFIPVDKLLKWSTFVKKRSSTQERLTFSRRTQAQIAKKGVPLPGSYRYSKNGRRLNWVKFGLEKVQSEIDAIIQDSDLIEKIILDQLGSQP